MKVLEKKFFDFGFHLNSKASGFIAGGALLGVLNAFLKFVDLQWPFGYAALYRTQWADSHGGEITGLIMFILLCAYAIWDSMRAKE